MSLDELHNDSTTVSFHGAYAAAAAPRREAGRPLPAITWGHSKDHRPDLKQLLFTLTLSRDGGVPVYFQVDSGNTNDDDTHRQTWDLLRQLVGHAHFLYVANCKLASRENLRHLAARNGRFVTVLPASRGEDETFRARLRKAEGDEAARVERSVRATRDLEALRQRLVAPRSRLRQPSLRGRIRAILFARFRV